MCYYGYIRNKNEIQNKVEILKQALKEIKELNKQQQKALKDDIEIIETKGLEYIKRRYLREALFEIKTNDVRALFKYQENRIILIGLVYEKNSQKAPEHYIKTALKRLKEV